MSSYLRFLIPSVLFLFCTNISFAQSESPSLFFDVIGPGCSTHVKDPKKEPLARITYDTGEVYLIPNYFGGSVFRELRLGFGSSKTTKTFKDGSTSSTGIKLCEEKAKAFAKKNGYSF